MPAALVCAALLLLLAGSPGAQPLLVTPPVRLEVTHSARAPRQGDIVTLHVTASAPLRRLEASAFGRTTPFFPAGKPTDKPTGRTGERWTALIGVDVEAEPGPATVSVRAVTSSGESLAPATHTLVIAPRRFASRHLRVDPRFSDPPASVRARIASEATRLEAIFSTVSDPLAPDVPFAAPVPQPSNSRFGLRSFFNGKPRGRHNGVDFPSPAGTPIHAPGRGRVVLVDDLYFTGHTVVIDHGYGLYTLFAHLERTATTTAAVVRRGEVVGYVGATGRVTGPHLHWSMRLQGARVDPLSLTMTTRKKP